MGQGLVIQLLPLAEPRRAPRLGMPQGMASRGQAESAGRAAGNGHENAEGVLAREDAKLLRANVWRQAPTNVGHKARRYRGAAFRTEG